jgi:hypothetical protein
MDMKIAFVLAAMLVALTGCLGQSKKTVEPAPAKPGYEFTLSPKEQAVYNSFQKDLDEQHLQELGPISIAKLYVQAALNNNREVLYALYTDKTGHVLWTKEEFGKFPKTDTGLENQERTLKLFNNIEKGVFIQTSDFEGYIEYMASTGTEGTQTRENKSGFQMIKDDDGIWNVAFQPIQ